MILMWSSHGLMEMNLIGLKNILIIRAVEPGRFRDIGVLKYIFRSLEKNMPWVRKIHFVTNGQYPTWLNLEHPKIYFHAHKDFFIYKDALPVFNSNAIELNFANIPDLSERFILFNDDMLVLKQVKEERFLIMDCQSIIANYHTLAKVGYING